MIPNTTMESTSVNFGKLSRSYESITVPVPWGHIAGKWWGPRDLQPVIALHGWLENANTWDPLMNLMPDDLAFLAIDLPGNGLSSHFPCSTWYNTMEDVTALRALIKHFGWTQPVTFLCHSLSTGHAYIYAAIFPNAVAKVIAVDFITPMCNTMETFLPKGGDQLDQAINIVDGVARRPPELSLERHAERHSRLSKRSLSVEAAKHVLQRSMVPSERDPLLFRNRSDPRFALLFWVSFANEFVLELGRKVECEYYVISVTGRTEHTFASRVELRTKGEEILRASTRNFELVRVPGTHHVHLEHPERILPLILGWIRAPLVKGKL